MNKERPDFLEYYISQLFSSRWREITARNLKSKKNYREVHSALYRYIYIIQFAIAGIIAVIVSFIKMESSMLDWRNAYLYFWIFEIAFILLFPFRYFFVKFKEIAEGDDSTYGKSRANKTGNNGKSGRKDTNDRYDSEEDDEY